MVWTCLKFKFNPHGFWFYIKCPVADVHEANHVAGNVGKLLQHAIMRRQATSANDLYEALLLPRPSWHGDRFPWCVLSSLHLGKSHGSIWIILASGLFGWKNTYKFCPWFHYPIQSLIVIYCDSMSISSLKFLPGTPHVQYIVMSQWSSGQKEPCLFRSA